MKKLSPAKRKRVEFFSITTAVFFSTAVLLGLLFGALVKFSFAAAGDAEMAEFPLTPAAMGVIFGLVYGLIISMIIGAIMLFARFMSDKPLWLKILAAVLWPITYMCIGMVMYAVVPYWIYNTVKMFMREKPTEVLWSAENYSSLAEQSAAQSEIAQPAVVETPAIEQPAVESAPAIEPVPEVEAAPEVEDPEK